jgi:hypothetical protein
MKTNVAQIGSAQQRIAYCMNQHIGIGMSDSTFAGFLQPDASQIKRFPSFKFMYIEPHAYAYVHLL